MLWSSRAALTGADKSYLANVRNNADGGKKGKSRGALGVGVVEVDGKAPKAVKSLALGPIKFTHQQLEKVRRAMHRIELR